MCAHKDIQVIVFERLKLFVIELCFIMIDCDCQWLFLIYSGQATRCRLFRHDGSNDAPVATFFKIATKLASSFYLDNDNLWSVKDTW